MLKPAWPTVTTVSVMYDMPPSYSMPYAPLYTVLADMVTLPMDTCPLLRLSISRIIKVITVLSHSNNVTERLTSLT